jgi:hypothetical protein
MYSFELVKFRNILFFHDYNIYYQKEEKGWNMYKDNHIDFDRIFKALESAYEELQQDHLAQEAIQSIKEAEENVHQALNFNLSTPLFRSNN